MAKIKSKISFWIFSLLYSILTVTAYHSGGHGGGRTLNPTGISQIQWMLFIGFFLGIAALIYWLFTKEERKF